MLQENLKEEPQNAEIHFTIADWAFYGLSNPTLAFKEAEAALELDTRNTFYRYWYARWLYCIQDYNKAISQYEMILQQEPDNKKAREWLVKCKREKKKSER